MNDNLSDSILTIYYRMPTPKEHIWYTNNMTKRKGNRVINNLGELRQQAGARLITGYANGNFERPNNKGGWTPFDSDPRSPHYLPTWLEELQTQAPDVLESLAMRVFESPLSMAPAEETQTGDDPLLEDPGEDASGNLPETSTP
jgi:hypothetical protein